MRDGIEHSLAREGRRCGGSAGYHVEDGTRRVREESVLRYSGCSRRRRTLSHRRQTFRLQRNNKRAFPTDLPLPMLFGLRMESTNDAECKYETEPSRVSRRGARFSATYLATGPPPNRIVPLALSSIRSVSMAHAFLRPIAKRRKLFRDSDGRCNIRAE